MESKRWLEAYPTGIPHHIDIAALATLDRQIERSFRLFTERPAASCLGETVTYGQLDKLSQQLAAYLQQQGISQGDRIALILPTCNAFLVGLCAALRSGLVVVAINPLYTPRELQHQLQDSGATCAIVADMLVEPLRGIVPRTPLKVVLSAPLVGIAKASESLMPSGDAIVPLASAIFQVGSRAPASVAISPASHAFLQYTGGTTGVSKGAVLTHRCFAASLAQMRSWAGAALEAYGASIITPLPLYHIYPLATTVFALTMGACSRLVPNPREPGTVIAEMGRQPFEMMIGVNTLFSGLLNMPGLAEVDFSKTQLVTAAGASVQAAVAQRWTAAGGIPITEVYGLSETAPSTTFNPWGCNGTIGMPVPSTDVRIVDAEEQDVPIGQPGELILKGPQLFEGYWNCVEETVRAFTADGWFRTGDIVVMDKQGSMTMVDRKKDMILVSGFNVYPTEIEGVVSMMEEVLECCCIGTPDARSGEVPHLFVIPRNPGVTTQSIEAYCRANLAAYKVPRHITLLDSLPKSAIGKVLRRKLRSELTKEGE
ncbi:AMP-binding protein [Janthinobacterium agaricidamnosum]|uniref:Long-chain-fatty-acid--CoA ligase n=1 Tax=Janthinobacterium agaricidamnosum NBRC 102515 = DSM 9628 TaxID=1349767 RepID=W0VAQ2_9BURK|nr:AMP-binding protein [Janthinobacterium agaricidamnosum]CDG84690.1 AMP-binding enzyme family protein [Janthinobacterium agaricidamnosum NBRC 102515 = DSM 9628]